MRILLVLSLVFTCCKSDSAKETALILKELDPKTKISYGYIKAYAQTELTLDYTIQYKISKLKDGQSPESTARHEFAHKLAIEKGLQKVLDVPTGEFIAYKIERNLNTKEALEIVRILHGAVQVDTAYGNLIIKQIQHEFSKTTAKLY